MRMLNRYWNIEDGGKGDRTVTVIHVESMAFLTMTKAELRHLYDMLDSLYSD